MSKYQQLREVVATSEEKEDTDMTESKKGQRWHYWIGTLLAFASGVIFTANNLVFKAMALDHVDTLLVRSVIQICFLSLWILAAKMPILFSPAKLQLTVLLQGLASGVILLCSYVSVALLPLGDAMTLLFSTPIFTLIMERLVLKTPMHPYRILCTSVLFLGIILVSKPQFIFGQLTTDLDPNYYLGVVIALTAAFFGSISYVSISAAKEKATTTVLVWYSGMGQFFVSIFTSVQDENDHILSLEFEAISCSQWVALVCMGLFGIMGFLMMTKACKMADPTSVSMVRSLEIVLAVVAQILLFQDMPNGLSILGSSLVVLSVLALPLQHKLANCFLPTTPKSPEVLYNKL